MSTPGAAPVDYREEISFLRQKFGSLVTRGQYKECFKLIEDNIPLLYFKERWPEKFLSSLTFHKRCFPAMDIATPYFEYLADLLKKNGAPPVIARLMKDSVPVAWSAEKFKELTLEAQGEGNLEDALGYVDLMIKIDPLSSSAYVLKGWILRDLKRDKEAIECFERALELNKTNFQARSFLAEIYAVSDPAKALELIDAAIAGTPGVSDLQAAKARILLAGGNREGAMAAYDEANMLDPLNAEYIFQKAEILLADGQDLAAVLQYNKVLTVSEGHIPTLTRLANLLSETQPETALSYVNRVVDANPRSVSANLLKARLLRKGGHAQAAIRQYNNVLELDPACAPAYGALGKLYMPDSSSRALTFWSKAVELEPGSAEYLIGKGSCHELLGENAAAVAAYKEAVSRDQKSAKAYASLGTLLMESDPGAALGYLEKAISLNPENAYYHQAKGELLLKNPGKHKDAMDCFDTAVRFDPGNAQLRYTLGSLLEQNGRIASALEHYRTAVNLDTGLEEAYHALARLLWESEPDNALIYINSAINISPTKAEYYYLKSVIYIKLGEKPELLRGLTQTIGDEKKNIDALHDLRQMMDGDTPRVAMRYINRALEFHPSNPVYICVLARLFRDMGESKRAMDQYRRAAEIDPGRHEAWYGLGKLLADNGNYDKNALEYLEKAITLAPETGRYLAEKAVVISRDPFKYAEALNCFDEALARDNQMCDAVIAKARLLEEHGEAFEAMAYLKRALLINRNCLEATAKLGILLADINPSAALVYLDKAIELEPESYLHRIWKSRALYALGNDSEAEKTAQEALHLGGTKEETEKTLLAGTADERYFTLAQILYERMPEVSLKYCMKAIELAPEKAPYILLRGNIHRRLGEDGPAISCFKKALELDESCHEALARIAEYLYHKKDPLSLEMIERAIAVNGGNASYYYVRSLILDEIETKRTQDAISCIQEAISLSPANILYREKLIELLKKGGSWFQRFVEKRRLDKLRRKLAKAEAEAKAI